MPTQPAHSLKHEYALYIEREVERYKDSIPRTAMLALGDEAVTQMRAAEQLELGEIVLREAVDEIIVRRLRLPHYQAWRRRRLRLQEQYRRAETWGLAAGRALVEAVRPEEHPHVVVAGPQLQERALYLAANGAHVTALGEYEDESLVDQVLVAAAEVGLAQRIEGFADGIDAWLPTQQVRAVIWHASVLEALGPDRVARVLTLMQDATADGGVHFIEGVDGTRVVLGSASALAAQYPGWDLSQAPGDGVVLLRKPRVA
ncbi:MAG: hypothetical protein MUF21_02100 [Gemmatimonadaceae bacterium]|nr:hypothetical protein [Gemmatimonadaceae bacterium]